MKSKIIFAFLSISIIFTIIFYLIFNNVPRVSYKYVKETDTYSLYRVYGNKKNVSIKNTYSGKKVTKILDNAFIDSKVENVFFEGESNVTIISRNSFKDCKNLKKIIIPTSVKKIERFAFSGCTSLESVEFAENSSLESLGGSVFSNCVNLQSLILPDSLKSVGSYAFSNCIKITEMSFSKNVEFIEGYVFSGDVLLKSVSYYKMTNIDKNFLYNTKNVKLVIK